MGTFNDGDSGSSIRTKINTAIQKTEGTSAISTIDVDGGAIDGVTLGTNSAVTEAQVDNININGNTISSTDTNGDVIIDPNGTGNVKLGNFEFDADQTVGSGQDNYVLTYDHSSTSISLEAAAGGSGSLSGNMAGDIASNGHEIKFADSGAADQDRLTFGASDDLEIYHDGSNSYIKEGGTGDLRLQAANLAVQNTFGQYMIEANNGGGVNLYHNTALKVGTLSDGAAVRGQLKIQNSGGTTQYTFPTADGSANQVLQTNGSGALSFATVSGGGSLALFAENASGETTPTATGTNDVAIGTQAEASGNNSIALGFDAVASGSLSFAGADGTASGVSSIAIGESSVASQSSSIAIGPGTDATATSAAAFGKNAQAAGQNSVSLGNSYSSGTDSFAAAIDNNTSSYGATAANSIAIGKQAKATNTGGVAIGENNIAQGDLNASAIGGKGNTASGYYAIASGGQNNTVTGARSGILAGSGNTVSGSNSVILGGGSNTASGQHSYVFGQNSTASENYAIATGHYSKSDVKAKIAHSSGNFSVAGDAQGGQFVLRADTTDATATVLTSDNGAASTDNQIVAASDTCISFHGTIVGMQNGAQAYAAWEVRGLLVNDGGTTTLANSSTTVIQNSSSWGMALSADNTNNALAITVTGEASHNIRWVANISTSEVTYA